MDDQTPREAEIDERWLGEWFEFGMAELAGYLRKHAAFEAYCDEHDGE